MGCAHSKNKSRSKKSKEEKKNQDEGSGKVSSEDVDVCVQKQLEHIEWSVTEKIRTETTADLSSAYEQRIKRQAEEHDRAVAELQRQHLQDKTVLTESFQAAETLLQGQVVELTADLQVYNQLKRRVQESTFKKDLLRNIESHGSPGAFWESEQESLLFVIEMKSERVQEQGKKLQQLQSLAEKNQALEEQIMLTLQQNEDLCVRMGNYQSLIQQLSKEQQELKGALDRQTAITQKLSQEKEQLVFRLRHRDTCPSMHLPVMLSEVAP